MNTSAYILEYLKEFKEAKIPNFGVFTFVNSKAVFNPEDQSILPPAFEIAFSPDYQLQSEDFVHFLSVNKGLTRNVCADELQIQTDYWKKVLLADKRLAIEELGTFILDGEHLHFNGRRVEVDSPDFYGLEAIKFSEIKGNTKGLQEEGSDYSLSKSPYFWIVILAIIGSLVWVGYDKQEELFGKKSEIITPVEPKIAEPVIDNIVIDSLSWEQDSIKTDSLTTANPL